MVDAQTYLNTNYPVANRANITSLDLNNKDLEGDLILSGFTNLKRLDISFNPKLANTDYTNLESLEEINNSNSFVSPISDKFFLNKLKRINDSHLSIMSIVLNTPALTHLDTSNNLLKSLDLSNSNNLVEVDCSNNPSLANLSLPANFNPIFLNCQNTKLDKVNTTSFVFDCQKGTKLSKVDVASPASSVSLSPVVQTTFVDNPQVVTGLAIPLGVSVFGWLALGSFFIYRKWGQRGVPTPGS